MEMQDVSSQVGLYSLNREALLLVVISLLKNQQASDRQEEVFLSQISYLKDRIKKLEAERFGQRSEKNLFSDYDFLPSLFPELDGNGDLSSGKENPGNPELIAVPEHKRVKAGRKPLPPELPRYQTVIDVPEVEKICECGCQKRCIGQEVSETLEMLPAYLYVSVQVRPKYACKRCEGVESDGPAVSIAALPPAIIPKSMASPSLLAQILVSKFADALPLYRQEQQFLRYGIHLPRGTMCRWLFAVYWLFLKLLELLDEELLSGPVVGVDETWVRVLHEENKKRKSKCYMWVFCGGPPGKRVIHFQYSSGRNGRVASDFLLKYRGIVQSDGYGGYHFLDTKEGVLHVGCWAHARRQFVEVVSLYEDGNETPLPGTSKAVHALKVIGRLYEIEKRAKELTDAQRYELRQKEAKPILDEFKTWLQENALYIPPKSPLGKAFNYTIGQWTNLYNYLKDGRVPIDNNLTENAIRPFVVGRKNWLFSDQSDGAKATAVIYSLLETAKANNLEPYSYFLYLLDRLPYAKTNDDLKQLLPTHIKQEILTEFKHKYFEKFNIQSLPPLSSKK